MRAVLVLAAALSSSSALALELPRYDVETHCKEVAGFGGTYSASIDQSCFTMEQGAYNAIKAMWGSVSANIRKHCDEVASFGGGGSYSILQSCIEMEAEADSANTGRSFKY